MTRGVLGEEMSYVWLELVVGGGVLGVRMPIDPVGGAGSLSEEELADLETWIIAGALEDG